MQIGPTQTIPWHYHTEAQDTFYVVSGSICIRMRATDEQVVLAPGQSCVVRAGRPHSVENATRPFDFQGKIGRRVVSKVDPFFAAHRWFILDPVAFVRLQTL